MALVVTANCPAQPASQDNANLPGNIQIQSARQVARDAVASAGCRFVELLAKRDFAGAVTQFDTAMKTASPESKLREIWQVLQTQAGPFQKQLGVRTGNSAGYDVALVSCQFERTTLNVKVVFDTKRQIAGFFILPSQGYISQIPSYAMTNAFHEKNFTVGKNEWRLPGTLTVPNAAGGSCPAVVLVHGSGPEDRDETDGANKPFCDLAWGLATKGIAVLRYEKRTEEYNAKFRVAGFQYTVQEETIDDALSAVAQLRSTEGIDSKRIFVLGHSLGGMLAPRIGQADPQIAGLIILAGPTRSFEDIEVEQTQYLISQNGKPSAEDEAYLSEVQATVAKMRKLTAADTSSPAIMFGAPASYWLDLHQHDTLAIAKGLKQPMLILQGERDYQVTLVDFNGWKAALGSQRKATFKLYPQLNHLFIAGEGKSTPAEYDQPGHVAEPVVTDIAEWIQSH